MKQETAQIADRAVKTIKETFDAKMQAWEARDYQRFTALCRQERFHIKVLQSVFPNPNWDVVYSERLELRDILDLIDRDLVQSPDNAQAIPWTLLDRIQSLVGDTKVDLDEQLPDEDVDL